MKAGWSPLTSQEVILYLQNYCINSAASAFPLDSSVHVGYRHFKNVFKGHSSKNTEVFCINCIIRYLLMN